MLVKENKVFRFQLIALVVSVLLMAIKVIAYLMTKSNIILSDALESTVNIAAGAIALYSLILSVKPRDKEHPYGHGKIEFITSGLEGGMIVLSAGIIIWKGVEDMFKPTELLKIDLGIILISVAGLANLILGLWLESLGKKHKSIILESDGIHLKTDGLTSFLLIAGLVLIYFTHLVIIDNILAILIGCYLVYTGARLLRRALSGIMDESDEELIEELIGHFNAVRTPSLIDIHNLRIIRYGSKLHVDCHVTLPYYFTLEEAHQELVRIEKSVSEIHGESVEFFIHGDPCIESSCRICLIDSCTVRKFSFQQKLTWSAENLIPNKKHGSSSL